MSTAHVNDDALTDLVSNLMSREDAGRALDHIESCAACEERFRGLLAARETARARGFEMPAERRAIASILARWPVVVAAVAAASILIAVGLPRLSNDGGAAAWIPVEDNTLTRRTGTGSADSDLWRGLDAYRARDARTAVEALSASQARGVHATLRDVYLASALAHDDRFREALAVVERLEISLLPQPWRDEVSWVRATALIETGREAEATAFVDSLADGNGPVSQRARALRERLRDK